MLVWLLDCCAKWFFWETPALRSLSFRAGLAAVTAFALALVIGPRLIGWLRQRFHQPLASPSERINQLHQSKRATPTLGGLLILASLMFALLLLGDLTSPQLGIAGLLTVALGTLGLIDDLAKLRPAHRGLSARCKFAWQLVIALVIAWMLYRVHRDVPGGLEFQLPGLAWSWSLGWLFIPLAMLVLVGSSNAVNLTDGLDGLAGGCLLVALAAMATGSYATGDPEFAAYLGVSHLPIAQECLLVACALMGAVLGFLRFNRHPAQVFMGDTGSLPLGGLLGFLAVAARQELLLLVVGGVFVAEALSVVLQVGVYKWKRQRVFLCAPLHHHFQFLGWPEGRIVVRFWIAGVLCAVVGLAGMKFTAGQGRGSRAERGARLDRGADDVRF